MNNSYEIKVEAPLVRPGLTITTRVSEKYVVPATRMLLTQVRALNDEVSMTKKLEAALRHTEDQLVKECARNRTGTDNP